MWQGTRWDRGDLVECISLEYLHHIQSANRHVSELTTGVSNDVDVIGDGAGVDHLDHVEWRPCIERYRLAYILERQPHLIAVRCRSDIGAERAFLLDTPDDVVRASGNDDGFWAEAGADISIFAVGREDRHAGTIRHRDTGLLLKALAVEDGYIVLAAYGDPNFFAIRRKEGLMRRAADIGNVLNSVCCGIDKCHGVGADRHRCERTMIGRKSHPVHQQLPSIEWAEISRRRVTKANGAEHLIVGRINDRHGVGELVRRVETVAMTYRDVWRVRSAGSLSRKRGNDTGQQQGQCEAESHCFSSFSSIRVQRRMLCARAAFIVAPRIPHAGSAASARSPAAARQ